MRALLLYNPNATTTTPAVTDVIAHALSHDLKLEVHPTKRRNHASFLAAGAVHEGYEVVVALGGDGTVNEVVQGIAGTPVRLAIIPGGSTNVYARILGLPTDPVEATSLLLRNLRERRERVVPLGRANGRWFTFSTGLGFDAEVVRLVEQRHRLKRTVRQASFIYCGFRAAGTGFARRAAEVTVRAGDAEPVSGFRSVVCCNADPYTFLGPWSARLCPDADIDGGLDLTALTTVRLVSLLRLLPAALRAKGDVRTLRTIETWHDHPSFELSASEPMPWQVDGDYVGETDQVSLELRQHALTVVT